VSPIKEVDVPNMQKLLPSKVFCKVNLILKKLLFIFQKVFKLAITNLAGALRVVCCSCTPSTSV